MCYILLLLLLLKLYIDYARNTFTYTVGFLMDMLGQVRGCAPLNLVQSRVAFATDRSNATLKHFEN